MSSIDQRKSFLFFPKGIYGDGYWVNRKELFFKYIAFAVLGFLSLIPVSLVLVNHGPGYFAAAMVGLGVVLLGINELISKSLLKKGARADEKLTKEKIAKKNSWFSLTFIFALNFSLAANSAYGIFQGKDPKFLVPGVVVFGVFSLLILRTMIRKKSLG